MIYIDLDDVIADTSKLVIRLAFEMFNKKIQKKEIFSFDLLESLSLNKKQYEYFMTQFHLDDNILSIPINDDFKKLNSKYEREKIKFSIVTGRPIETKDSTVIWLKKNNIVYDELLFIDKYNRYNNTKLESFDSLIKYQFSFGIEDSYSTALTLSKKLNIPFFVYRQPWNVKYEKDINPEKIIFIDSFDELEFN